MSARYNEALNNEISFQYERTKIAFLTGWTFDYIDSLGLKDFYSILQIYEAENALKNLKGKKWP